VLDGGLPARLLRLGQVPADDLPGHAEALRAELEASLTRLEAE
jgi:hypothetical protein